MVGRVSYPGRVKQGNNHTHVLYTIPNPNYTLPKPYPFIITYPIHHPTLGTQTGRVLHCANINTTLDTYLSLSFSDQKRIAAFQPFNTALFKTNFNFMIFLNYEGCQWIFETLAILSKGKNIIQINLHSHQVLHIWDLVLNYLIAAFNGYDSVAFWRLISPLHRSTSHNVGVSSTSVLIYFLLHAHAIINYFASKCYLWQR